MEVKEKENIRLRNIIEALGMHEDETSVEILERIGTNSEYDEVRELTAKALIQRNTHKSLCPVIIEKGKGINDLSPRVAMSAISDILELKDKQEVVKILDDTINMHSDADVRESASSVRALIELAEVN